MTPADFLLPVFVQVALTFALHVWMAQARTGALKRKDVRIPDIVLGQSAWPARVTQIGNSYHNQYELPVLFYALIAFILITNTGNYPLLILAWLFVIARIAHAFVHTTTNRLQHRFLVYAVGFAILLAMWVIFAVRILAAPALA